jgi:Domain of unknown function (DUF305)
MEKNHWILSSIKALKMGDWLRIGILVLIIIAAYAGWVIAGMNTWEHSKSKYWYPKSMKMEGNKERWSYTKYINQMEKPTRDHMDMSMREMGAMLEGKTGDALNKAFLEGMIPHHQWAVEMAKYLAASNKPELVKLGGEIISAQTKEIEQMKAWQIAWGYSSTGTTATGMMMDHSMMNH